MVDLPQKELIRKAQNGDKAAYKELFDMYKAQILNYLYKYVGDYQVAENITIDTFMEVYKSLPVYREEGKFLSWVYKIATNFAKNYFRKRNRAKEVFFNKSSDNDKALSVEDISSDDSLRPDYSVVQKELLEKIEKIILGLDEKYKDVLLLCDFEDMSYEKAADILKCTKVAVGVRLKRAREKLYMKLKRQGYSL